MTHVSVKSLSKGDSQTAINDTKIDEDEDEKYLMNASAQVSTDKYQKRSLSTSQKAKQRCSTMMNIIVMPFLLISIFISQVMLTNIICSIVACILIAVSNSSSMQSMHDNVTYIYASFIIRNLIYILILSHYKHPYNKFRVLYSCATNLAIIIVTINDISHISDYSDYDTFHALLICMSFTLLCGDLWLISSLTLQPNKLRDSYFEINQALLSNNVNYVGKHASEIQLEDISFCVAEMKSIYKSNVTRIISNRKEQLRNILKMVQENEEAIIAAIKADMGRPDLMCAAYDIYTVCSEIKHLLNKIDEWCAPENMGFSLVNFPATNYTVSEPLGTVFVNGIWNFPFQLAIAPIVGAISAGNNVVVKTCNTALNCSNLLCDLLHKYVDSRFVQCIGHSTVANGDDRVLTAKILENEFDLIFFTGSTNGGKYIMSKAAENLTPVILELGGKNPCFVDNTADIRLAAKQLINARMINAGQQCISPDYVFICKDVLDEFLYECTQCIQQWYGLNEELKDDLGVTQGKLINEAQFKRVCELLNSTKGQIIIGGSCDERHLMIEPTVVLLSDIKNISGEPTIKQETFGPVLWVVPIESNEIKDAVHYLSVDCGKNFKPLSLYIFSECRKTQDFIVNNTSSGAVQINGTLVYAAHHSVRFGGVGASGMGCYHGINSFNAFSHKKSVVRSWFVAPLVYPPYSLSKKTLFKLVL